MKNKILKATLLSLFPIALLLNYISSLNPDLTEKLYSTKLNKYVIQLISHITNIFPISLYDIFICITILCLISYLIYTFIIAFRGNGSSIKIISNAVLNILATASLMYFLFVTLWGMNYNRVSFSESIGLPEDIYTKKELSEFYEHLIDEVNTLRTHIDVDSNNIMTIDGGYKSVFNRSQEGYNMISHKYPTLSGKYGNPKPLLSSELFNYTGITGIYFPFTAQANVNVKEPIMTLPFTTMHEMAHQRGYAHENEANFIAFLTCINHPDSDFKYSGYLTALGYTSNALYKEDRDLLMVLNSKLSDDVRSDIIYKSNFWQKYEGPVDKISSKVNDVYLKSNGIQDGEKSYGRIVDLLLNYYTSQK